MAATKWTRWKRLFTLSNIESIPNTIGVYGYWRRDNGRCIYIGKAERQPIGDRIKSELRSPPNRKFKTWIRCFRNSLEICYLPVPHDKMGRVDSLETRLIRMWDPETNIYKRRKP